MKLENQLFDYSDPYQQDVAIWGFNDAVFKVPITDYEIDHRFDYVEIDYSTSTLTIFDLHGEVESTYKIVVTLEKNVVDE